MFSPNLNPRPRILVVDDEILNRQLLQRILKRDYLVDLAENGKVALEKLSQAAYDVVLLDMMMPVLSGEETLHQIRRQANLAELPVIIVSAMTENQDIARGIQSGANDYISKPLDMAVVEARVRTQVMLKRLMDERRGTIEALEAANRLKDQMMQIASHDLRNPLHNLQMLLHLLKKKVTADTEAQSLTRMAEQTTKTMLGLVQDFLSQAKIETKVLELKPIRVLPVLERVLEQYRIAAAIKEIDLEILLEDSFVFGDTQRLEQVFANLLSNAIKYSPRRGHVVIRSLLRGQGWRLEVEDNGPGISEAERQHLFTAYSKDLISSQPSNGESSTGLGLWIAAEMMRLQKGTIGMDTAQTGGCCFWLELALASEMAVVK